MSLSMVKPRNWGNPEPLEAFTYPPQKARTLKFNRLRTVSPQRAKLNQEYERVKRLWWAARLEIDKGRCQFIDEEGNRCQRQASPRPHHIQGRGRNLCKSGTFAAVCADCHRFIHDNPRTARRLGFLK